MAKKKKEYSGKERRKSERRPIIDSFSFFVVVPSRGVYRLPVCDVSEDGIGFMIDMEGEDAPFEVGEGEKISINFYLNQSLFIPVDLSVARIIMKNDLRMVGGEFLDKDTNSYRGVFALLQMIDQIGDSAEITS